MPTLCEHCGQSNRATAMFCIGCAGKLPGFAPSGPSALEAMKALSLRRGGAASDGASESSLGEPLLPSETKAFWLQLGALGIAMSIGFVVWFLHATGRPSVPSLGKLMQSAETTVPEVVTKEVVAVAPQRSWPPSIQTVQPTPEPRAAAGLLPGTSASKATVAKSSAPTGVASSLESSPDRRVQAVRDFYRALSAADGRTAAAFVVPAKRGLGPVNEANISRFYGSFDRPLLVRSIRPIDATLVEARYSYRVSRTTCEGTAFVETERVGRKTLIRRIRANC
ncbi:hypothetical protein QTI33_08155 [Variovorax sp. J22P271]|uniref:hypothetical protein n=1 Tax=Variovorax davisae TaxID=3053515 RepID=UPI0025754F16|nr:hypothetical protein [Variovorax sp. J22P271]MDM0032109.1 hypothetical protein [Variovorax sp. J22P271]